VSVEVLGKLTVQLTQRRSSTKHDITRLVYRTLVILLEILVTEGGLFAFHYFNEGAGVRVLITFPAFIETSDIRHVLNSVLNHCQQSHSTSLAKQWSNMTSSTAL